ncbi:MAG: hypothetical protein JWL63_318 [Rhodocyclales bacterium]|nr:hypothetical protein [Rhodocyclales bacterium]
MQCKHNKTLIAVVISTLGVLAASSTAAQTRGSLFDDDDIKPPAKTEPAKTDAKSAPDDDLGLPGLRPGKTGEAGVRFSGNVELGMYRTVGEPDHWSHERIRTSLNAQGSNGGLKWKVGGRLDADGAFVGRGNRYYNADVRDNQRLGFELRENYIDKSVGSWEMRLGKQNVVWGEMVGVFVADVVSPRDLRDFLSTDLENVRRTTWAARFEKFSGDWHSELLWVPVQTYDNIGKPGTDFYPYPAPVTPGYAYLIDPEQKPKNDFSNGGFGARTGFLKDGWDVSAFYYASRDVAQTFERRIVTTPVAATIYTPVHDRIRQFGGTVAKDVGGLVFKGEAVVTSGRRFVMTRLDDDDGLQPSRSVDLILGLDYTPSADWRLNFQVLDRSLTNHDASMLVDKHEQGGSVLTTWNFSSAWEAQLLWATSFNRSEGWINPGLTWKMSPGWRLRMGADFFYGPSTGSYGQYDNQDRAYVEVRYGF